MGVYVQIRRDASEPWRTIGIFGAEKDASLFADAFVRYIDELADKSGDSALRRIARIVPADDVRQARRRLVASPALRSVG